MRLDIRFPITSKKWPGVLQTIGRLLYPVRLSGWLQEAQITLSWQHAYMPISRRAELVLWHLHCIYEERLAYLTCGGSGKPVCWSLSRKSLEVLSSIFVVSSAIYQDVVLTAFLRLSFLNDKA